MLPWGPSPATSSMLRVEGCRQNITVWRMLNTVACAGAGPARAGRCAALGLHWAPGLPEGGGPDQGELPLAHGRGGPACAAGVGPTRPRVCSQVRPLACARHDRSATRGIGAADLHAIRHGTFQFTVTAWHRQKSTWPGLLHRAAQQGCCSLSYTRLHACSLQYRASLGLCHCTWQGWGQRCWNVAESRA